MTKRPEKKSETIEVRVSYSEKQAFKEACEAAGTTASSSIRSYIARVLTPESPWNTPLVRSVLAIGVLVFAAGVVASFTRAPEPVDKLSNPFMAMLDRNGDGVVSAADQDLMDMEEAESWFLLKEKADQNKDGQLTRDELENQARVVVEFSAPINWDEHNPENGNVFMIPPGAFNLDQIIKDQQLDKKMSPENLETFKRFVTAVQAMDSAASATGASQADAPILAIDPSDPD